ncbi:substrate-binding domain-containing protein, partial [Spirochaetia bacterium 38H-sp]
PEDLIVTRDRMEGFVQAMRIRRIEFDKDMILFANSFSTEEGYRIASDILSCGKKIDAILASDDLLALGALKAMDEHKKTDIAVTGFNNTVQGQFNKPALTTVDIHPYELGYAAARLLISYINEEDNLPNHFIIDTDIIPRDTTRN